MVKFPNRLIRQKKIKYTWASSSETMRILKLSEYKLYNARKKVERNQLIEGVHYKRVARYYKGPVNYNSAIKYNLEKTCLRIHFIDLKIFTDPNYKFMDHCETRRKELMKYWPYDENGLIDITNLKDFTEEGVYVGN